MSDERDWIESRLYILNELKRVASSTDSLHKKLDFIRDEAMKERGVLAREIAILKVKAGVWGLAGGAVPVVIALLTKAYWN